MCARPTAAYLSGDFLALVASSAEVPGALAEAGARRAVGRSSVHDASSRSHCVVELEATNKRTLNAREAAAAAEASLHPLGKKRRDDARVAISWPLSAGPRHCGTGK